MVQRRELLHRDVVGDYCPLFLGPDTALYPKDETDHHSFLHNFCSEVFFPDSSCLNIFAMMVKKGLFLSLDSNMQFQIMDSDTIV